MGSSDASLGTFQSGPISAPDLRDLVTETTTVKGNVFNVHGGAGGILTNDSGQIIFAGEDAVIKGQHDASLGPTFNDWCAARAA